MPKKTTLEDSGDLDEYPSPFQKRAFWTAITAFSIVVIAAISVGSIILGSWVLGFLQPLLVPIAVAGIMAYLLEPVVNWLRKGTRWSRKTCLLTVFISFLLAVVLLVISVIVPALNQADDFARNWDKYQYQITQITKNSADDLRHRFDNPIVREYSQKTLNKAIDWLTTEGPKFGQKIGSKAWSWLMGAFGFFGYLLGLILVPLYLFFFLKESHTIKNTWSDFLPLKASKFKDEVVDTLQEINQYLASFFRGQMIVSLIDGALIAIALSLLGLPGALLIGVFLAILGLIPYIGNVMVMIPAVLIAIAHFGHKEVKDYALKNEIQSGQVTMVQLSSSNREERKYVAEVKEIIEVTVTGDSGPQKGYIPYQLDSEDNTPKLPAIGQTMLVTLNNGLEQERPILAIGEPKKRAWIMAHAWSYLPNMWWYPLIVLGIFITLQQINGLVTAPLIVGDSVGLHPLTVIFSVLFWSFLLGGLLGALLAIPLTAALKVLFRRYVWESRIEPNVGSKDDSTTPVET